MNHRPHKGLGSSSVPGEITFTVNQVARPRGIGVCVCTLKRGEGVVNGVTGS